MIWSLHDARVFSGAVAEGWMKRHTERPMGAPLVYTAPEQVCASCGNPMPICQVISRPVQGLNEPFMLVRRDRQCRRQDCPGPRPRPFAYAPRDVRPVLPNRIYGLDVTLCVGERHLREGVALAQITRDLKAQGVPLDQRHTGRVFRDFLALASLERGDDAALQARLRALGGIVLMCDGVQFDERSPVLYVAWDARTGTPLFGERKPYRGEVDLVPLLERVQRMDVPVIAVVTDKEKGLVPAVQRVFPDVPYQFCHTHFLKNCAKPLQPDLTALHASVRRRAEAVREISKRLEHESAKTDRPVSLPIALPSAPRVHVPSVEPLTEDSFAREVGDLVRVNSRVSGKAPFDPAELARHERLAEIHSLVREAREKKRRSTEPGVWPLIAELDAALTPTWHEARVAGRVRRHTEILRGLAHELSAAPDRTDRPASAAAARASWDAHLVELAEMPRSGLASPTGQFIDSVIRRAERYSDHLFHCFDDARIPASSNGLEQFFGISKRILRHALGCGSTTNTVVANLGAEPLLALHQLRQPRAMHAAPSRPATDFEEARRKIADIEAPGVRRRSMVRHLGRHLHRLRSDWLDAPAAEPDA